MTTIISPPECMKRDDYDAAEPARQRLIAKPRFRLFSSLPNLRLSFLSSSPKREGKRKDASQSSEEEPIQVLQSPLPANGDTLIRLDNSAIDDDEDKPLYRWAILCENQRGATIFSLPYYSHLSLLPTDPPPFTIPSISDKRSLQPNVTLSSYPLPDGTWRWVSKSWMIDMRSDSGEVQHDGFEYNWRFRQRKWRAEVGPLSAGGWVRRRRWVRLMMRPGRETKHEKEPMDGNGTGLAAVDNSVGNSRISWSDSPLLRDHTSVNSIPRSVTTPLSELSDDAWDLSVDEVWRADDAEQAWVRCHAIMKRVGRDGRKLELWKRWLEPHIAKIRRTVDAQEKGKEREIQPQQTVDDALSESSAGRMDALNDASPALEHITAVLRTNGDALLHSFIYPESRAQFIALLARARLLHELKTKLGSEWSASDVDFWSYAAEIGRDVKSGTEKGPEDSFGNSYR